MSILYPLFIQVALTFFLQGWMGIERVKAVREKTVRRDPNPGIRPIWPARAGVVSNAFQNQLEMPLLFYVAVIVAIIAKGDDYLMIVMAWTFVASRLVHAFIHTTHNYVPHRFTAYIVGSAVLIAMWVKLALHTVSAGA